MARKQKERKHTLIFHTRTKYSEPKICRYIVQETLKKLCEFSTVWADQVVFGSTDFFFN